MIDVAEIFGRKALDEEKLLAYDFEPVDGGGFSRTFQILGGEYTAVVLFSEGGAPSFRIFDGEGEEYLPARTQEIRAAA